jgi:hypothetical protein
MSISLTKPGQERGCDTSYRARRNDTHLTHGCIPLFRRFLGRLCARTLVIRSGTLAIQANWERAIGALRKVFP